MELVQAHRNLNGTVLEREHAHIPAIHLLAASLLAPMNAHTLDRKDAVELQRFKPAETMIQTLV